MALRLSSALKSRVTSECRCWVVSSVSRLRANTRPRMRRYDDSMADECDGLRRNDRFTSGTDNRSMSSDDRPYRQKAGSCVMDAVGLLSSATAPLSC